MATNDRHGRKSAFERLLDIELAAVAALALAFGAPQLFGYVPDVVLSGSMEPAVPAGSVAVIDVNADAGGMEVGDIAVYSPIDGVQVMHRIVGIGEDGYAFQGDANSAPDAAMVGESQIVGAYVLHVPGIGWAYRAFDENRMACMMAIGAANVAIWALAERSRKRGELRGERARGATAAASRPA